MLLSTGLRILKTPAENFHRLSSISTDILYLFIYYHRKKKNKPKPTHVLIYVKCYIFSHSHNFLNDVTPGRPLIFIHHKFLEVISISTNSIKYPVILSVRKENIYFFWFHFTYQLPPVCIFLFIAKLLETYLCTWNL